MYGEERQLVYNEVKKPACSSHEEKRLVCCAGTASSAVQFLFAKGSVCWDSVVK